MLLVNQRMEVDLFDFRVKQVKSLNLRICIDFNIEEKSFINTIKELNEWCINRIIRNNLRGLKRKFYLFLILGNKWNKARLSPGMYFVKLLTRDGNWITRRIVRE